MLVPLDNPILAASDADYAPVPLVDCRCLTNLQRFEYAFCTGSTSACPLLCPYHPQYICQSVTVHGLDYLHASIHRFLVVNLTASVASQLRYRHCFLSKALPIQVSDLVSVMCYQVVERYSVCRCLYHVHAIDPCAAHGQRGHMVQEKTVLVGYACSQHSGRRSGTIHDSHYAYSSGVDSEIHQAYQLR